MITQETIKEIYRKYRKRPSALDKVSIGHLEQIIELHNIEIGDDHIIINSIDAKSPFHALPLRCIHGVENFEDEVAIILRASIIFLNKDDDGKNIHIKMPKPSFWERLRLIFAR